VDNSTPAAPAGGSAPAGGTSAAPSTTVSKNDAIAALVPEKMKSAGVLNVGMANNYAPNEFKDDNGLPAGWSVDLTNALGQ